jgi:hypothetical protein
MAHHKARAEEGIIQESTLANYLKPIKLFCKMNDIILNWDKINITFPKGKSYSDDRAPTREEIKELLKYPDRRIKPIILVMASSGIRLESWDYLSYKDVEPIYKEGKLVAAKLRVYSNKTKDSYTTFITSEAYEAIQEYIDYRKYWGEKINEESPLIRDLIIGDKGGRGEPHLPKRLKSSGIKRLIEDAWKAQGLRKYREGKGRYDIKATHGFRKFFKTNLEKANIKSIYIESLMGHDIGLAESYFKPTEEELLEEYLKATSYLTIYETTPTISIETIEDLKKRVKELEDSHELILTILQEQSEAIMKVLEALKKGELIHVDLDGVMKKFEPRNLAKLNKDRSLVS